MERIMTGSKNAVYLYITGINKPVIMYISCVVTFAVQMNKIDEEIKRVLLLKMNLLKQLQVSGKHLATCTYYTC